MKSTDEQKEFESVQMMRFFAAVAVVISHASQALTYRTVSVGAPFWDKGDTGVDVFFAISGFVIVISTRHIASGLQGALGFIKRRLWRVIPMYYLFTGLKIILLLIFPALALRTVLSISSIINSLAFWPYLNSWGEMVPIVPVGWTLSFEMLFYIVFASAIVLSVPRVLYVTLVIVIILFTRSLFPTTSGAYRLADPFLLEFVYGMLLAIALSRFSQHPRRPLLGILAFTIGSIILVVFDREDLGNRAVTWGLPAALLLGGVISLESVPVCRKLFKRFDHLGNASYALYLSHAFVVPVVVGALLQLKVASGWLIILLATLCACVLASALHVLIERPLNKYTRERWIEQRQAQLHRLTTNHEA
jgi:exopolysaccharide production protein ExoZ